jgi:hypothetical protein
MSSRKRCEQFAQANDIKFTMHQTWCEYEFECSVAEGFIIADEGTTGYVGSVDSDEGMRKAWQELLKDMKTLANAELITVAEYIAAGGQA